MVIVTYIFLVLFIWKVLWIEQGEKNPERECVSVIIFSPQSRDLKFQRKGGKIFTEFSKLEAEDQLKASYFSILIKISKIKIRCKNNIAFFCPHW